jgi:hypothetical protein
MASAPATFARPHDQPRFPHQDGVAGQILELASLNAWLIYHTHDSRRSQPGFTDLTLSSAPRLLLFVEVKTQRGRIRPGQRVWLDQLDKVPGVEADLCRPVDWPTVVDVFGRRRR